MPHTGTATQLAPTASLLARIGDGGGFADATVFSGSKSAISLLAGVPDDAAKPVDALQRAYARLNTQPEQFARAFNYSNTRGIAALRGWIGEREGVDPERIFITTGGQQGLAQIVSALIDDDDLVAVDNPIWPLFLNTLEVKTKNLLPLTVESDGIDVDELERQLKAGAKVRALYTVPDFHNPAQVSLSNEKRRRIVELADQYGFWFIADNPYREVSFTTPQADVALFHHSPNTIHVNTFSKTLGPGIRLGWSVLPERIVNDFVQLRTRGDSQPSTLTQTLLAELLTGEPEFFDTNLEAARLRYHARAKALVHELETQLPGAFDATVPAGGYFLWARLTDDSIDWLDLRRAAGEEGLNYQPGAYFASGPGTDSDRHLRIAYGDSSEERLHEAVSRLARAYASVSGTSSVV